MGRYDEAIKCCNKALELNAQNADAWFNKGASLAMLGSFVAAIKCYDNALEINPKDWHSWANKGASLNMLGRYEEAKRCCSEALELNPQNTTAQHNKKLAEEKLTEQSKAQEAPNKSGPLPWNYAANIDEDAEKFLLSFRYYLPEVFQSVNNLGHDLVVIIVDVKQIRWQGLLALLYSHHGQPYYSPETVTGQKTQMDQTAYGPFYHAPTIEGKQLRIGVYAVEREWLIAELCAIRDIPIPFINWVKKAQTPKGMFTVAYFLKNHLGVRQLSADASIYEIPEE